MRKFPSACDMMCPCETTHLPWKGTETGFISADDAPLGRLSLKSRSTFYCGYWRMGKKEKNKQKVDDTLNRPLNASIPIVNKINMNDQIECISAGGDEVKYSGNVGTN